MERLYVTLSHHYGYLGWHICNLGPQWPLERDQRDLIMEISGSTCENVRSRLA